MPWSAGVYTRAYASWVNDANNNLPISATKFDLEDNDFAAGLNNCLTIDGLNRATANIPPAIDNTYTLGTLALRWSGLYTGVAALTASGFIPTAANVTPLGSAAFPWSNLYLGPNNAPVLDPVSGNVGYYKQTAAEVSASVTPTNYVYPPLDIRRYGADPTGVSDSTSAVMAAMAVANVLGGGTISWPVGTFLVGTSTQISYVYNNIYHVGAGYRATIIVNASSNSPAITIGNGVTLLSGGGVIGMTFTGKSGVTGVNGQGAVYFQKIGQFEVRDVYVSNFLSALYRGIYCINCTQGFFYNLQIQTVLLDGFTSINGVDLYATDCRSDDNGGSGVLLNNTQGSYFKGFTCYNNSSFGWDLASTTPSTLPNVNNFFQQCIGDTSGNDNWHISDSVDSYWVNCWGSTQQSASINTTACGFNISTVNSRQLFFTGCVALYNNKDGYLCFDSGSNAPTDIHFVNCQGGSPGVTVVNGNGRAGAGYGLELTGAVNHIRIIGGAFENNVSGSISLATSGTDVLVQSNPIGFVSCNQGTSSIGVGNSSVTVTHGLGFTPSLANIVVTQDSKKALSSISDYWVSNPTGTQFTVNSDVAVAGAAFNFAWRASYNGT